MSRYSFRPFSLQDGRGRRSLLRYWRGDGNENAARMLGGHVRGRKGVALVVATLFSVTIASYCAASDLKRSDAARRARDEANVSDLQKLIDITSQEAQAKNDERAYDDVALFSFWLCEVGHVQKNEKLMKDAVDSGLGGSERAIALNPRSSIAHLLEGELLGELVSLVPMGGMKYGSRSIAELQKAMNLDPNNSDAFLARGIAYLRTPKQWGGSADKADEYIRKAIELNPSSELAHLWLARVYQDQGKDSNAAREVQIALTINPRRAFAKSVEQQIASGERNFR